MKKLLLGLSAAISLVFFAACSSGDDDESKPQEVTSPATEEYEILSDTSFMGGSLMYSSTTCHFEVGDDLGIRFGKLKKVTKQAETGIEGADNYFQSGDFEVLEEIDDAERYGIIHISNVEAGGITFTCAIYNKEGSKKTEKSYSLSLGKGVDLDGDGKEDISYKVPGVARPEYENARYLNFICDEDKLYTTMFSYFGKEENGEAITGFFAINTDGNFLMLTDTEPTAVPTGFYHGDYIIYHYDPEVENSITGDAENYSLNYSDGGVKIYTVVADKTTGAKSLKTDTDFNLGQADGNWLDFETYFYTEWQFPTEGVKGPKSLLEAIRSDLSEADRTEISTEGNKAELVTKLNNILINTNYIKTIFKKYEVELSDDENKVFTDFVEHYPGEQYDDISKVFEASETAYQDYVSLVRNYLDLIYDESPCAEIETPTFNNAYIYMSLDLGDFSEYEDPTRAISDARLAKANDYSDYSSKKNAILKQFNDYKSFNVYSKKDQGYTLELKAGVKGSISLTGKRLLGSLGVAALVNAEADGDLAPIVRKRLFEYNQGIGKTFMAGYVPLNVRIDGQLFLEMDVSTQVKNFFAGFTGIFGGGIDVGLWWRIFPPKISTSCDRKTLCDTTWYAGEKYAALSTDTGKTEVTVNMQPGVNIQASGGIGPHWMFANATLPLNLKFNMPYTWDFANKQLTAGGKSLDADLRVGASLGFVIPVIKKKVSKDWNIAQLFKKRLDLNTMQWSDIK